MGNVISQSAPNNTGGNQPGLTVRAGQIIQVTLIVNNGQITPRPGNQFKAVGNSFYIVDSPIDLIIKTDASMGTLYPSQTGETFSVPTGNVYILGVPTNTINAGTFKVKIWVGFRPAPGFVDHRGSLSNPGTFESFPDTLAFGLQTIPGNSMFSTIFNLAALNPIQNYWCVALMIANVDPTNTVYYSTGLTNTAADYLMPFFPSQVYRVPVPKSWYPLVGGFLSVYNPNAASVSFTIAPIMSTNAAYLENSS